MEVPRDAAGKPLVRVGNGARETIPTVPYGNVTIGPAWVEKWVEDTPKSIESGLEECLKAAEKVLGNERNDLLAKLKAAGIK